MLSKACPKVQNEAHVQPPWLRYPVSSHLSSCPIKPGTQPKQNDSNVFNKASLPLGRPLWPEYDPHLFVRVDSSVEREIYIWEVFHKAVHEVVPQGWNAPVFRWAESPKDGLTSVNNEVRHPCTAVHLSSAPAKSFYRRIFYERASKSNNGKIPGVR